jgi:hypothetical protein
MAKKVYTVQPKKDKSIIKFTLKTELHKLPNKLHLDAQINYPARVHEDKRFKKPKHKGKIYNDD